jgi:hypothetical protein
MRRAAKRDVSEKDIVKLLRHFGVDVELTHRPFDAIGGFRGVTYLLEFKTGKAPFTEGQKKFMAYWRGGEVVVLRSVEEAKLWIDKLRGKHVVTVDKPLEGQIDLEEYLQSEAAAARSGV